MAKKPSEENRRTQIVVVDDASFVREAVRKIAEENNIEVLAEAENGNDAVRIVKEFSPDVVVMDMVLPLKNGVDAAREILSTHPRVRIIASTTEGQETMMLKALDAGCCDFIKKPFKAKDLVTAIERAALAK